MLRARIVQRAASRRVTYRAPVIRVFVRCWPSAAVSDVRSAVNRWLDRSARPTLVVLGAKRSAFQVCGAVGIGLGVGWAIVLALATGRSALVMVAVATVAVAACLLREFGGKLISGEENLVYYYDVAAAGAAIAAYLWLSGQPILPYLDFALLGLGVFLACGRIGCWMVGCCHGRPHRLGVAYRHAHAEAGFPSFLVGARLFPVQVVEALWVFGVALSGGVLLAVLREPAGSGLAWYLVMGGLGRFVVENWRGDVRRQFGDFSEAQWTAAAMMVAVLALEVAGVLPVHASAFAAAVLICVLALLWRRALPRLSLLEPRHVQEVAQAIEFVPTPNIIRCSHTSAGITISASNMVAEGTLLQLVALSGDGAAIADDALATLANLVGLLKDHANPTVIRRTQGVAHVLIPQRTTHGNG